MKIEYFGHACFRITDKNGTSITLDPFTNIGYELPDGLSTDILLCSHNHFDHAYTDGVRTKNILFDRGEFFFKGVKITGYKSFHDEVGGKKRGENTVFVIETDGVRLCHLGDYGEENIEKLKGELYGLDVLFIPIGGVYTIDGKKAKEIVDELKPKFVIPMHFKTPDLAIDIASEEEFISLFNKDDILCQNGEWEYKEEKQRIILMEKKR